MVGDDERGSGAREEEGMIVGGGGDGEKVEGEGYTKTRGVYINTFWLFIQGLYITSFVALACLANIV
jgi:hypothetical protein